MVPIHSKKEHKNEIMNNLQNLHRKSITLFLQWIIAKWEWYYFLPTHVFKIWYIIVQSIKAYLMKNAVYTL